MSKITYIRVSRVKGLATGLKHRLYYLFTNPLTRKIIASQEDYCKGYSDALEDLVNKIKEIEKDSKKVDEDGR